MGEAIYPHQIVALRKRLGLTQVEFADRLDVTISTVSKWETGKAVPKGARERMIRQLLTDHPPIADAATVDGTIRTYDDAISTWERDRAEREVAGESTGVADQILRVLRATRENILRVATDD